MGPILTRPISNTQTSPHTAPQLPQSLSQTSPQTALNCLRRNLQLSQRYLKPYFRHYWIILHYRLPQIFPTTINISSIKTICTLIYPINTPSYYINTLILGVCHIYIAYYNILIVVLMMCEMELLSTPETHAQSSYTSVQSTEHAQSDLCTHAWSASYKPRPHSHKTVHHKSKSCIYRSLSLSQSPKNIEIIVFYNILY